MKHNFDLQDAMIKRGVLPMVAYKVWGESVRQHTIQIWHPRCVPFGDLPLQKLTVVNEKPCK